MRCKPPFSQVFTTHHWMVRIFKLKPPKNRIRGKVKKSKSVSQIGKRKPIFLMQ